MTFRELSGICVTAIVMDAPRLGPKGEPAPRGLKHFAPGARIYIAPTSGYDVGCWERAICAGIHRDDNLLAVVWTDIRRLESFEVSSLPDDVATMLDAKEPGHEFGRWRSSEARDFVTWRNEVEKPDWDAEVKRSEPASPRKKARPPPDTCSTQTKTK